MQDRFKFRIWEKETKTMIELDAVGYSSFDPFAKGISRLILILSGLDNTFHYNKQCLYDNDKFSEPMQCTGLKDKNGKLIFEGDVIELEERVYKKLYKVYFQVIFENGSYYLKADFTTHSGFLQFRCYFLSEYAEEIEVIGNIYENPELLND